MSELPELLHHYWLRPEWRLELRLPNDLSRREAERLGAWVRQLPLDQESRLSHRK